MGLRDRINQNPRITTTVIGLVVAGIVAVIVVQVLANRRGPVTKMPDSFFTVDDGKTWFAASTSNVPPFDYNGKQAVRAYVFQCNGKKFVGFIERFTPEAHKLMVENKGT